MPLAQILDPLGEPLDLWISPNHEGRLRYVQPSELATASGRVGAPRTGTETTGGDDAGLTSVSDPNAVILCEPIFQENVPTWLRPQEDETPPNAPPGRVPFPSPELGPGDSAAETIEASETARARSELGVEPGSSVETRDPDFAHVSGTPAVFVTRPPPHVTCRACLDVFLDPVVARDGFTYCRSCAPGADDSASDLGASERVGVLRVLCRHGLRYVDNAAGVGRWTRASDGCSATVTFAERRKHEDECGFARAPCGLPYGDAEDATDSGDVDACSIVLYRHEREKHRAVCPYRLVSCAVPGCGARRRENRIARHETSCDAQIAPCPNGCPWRGMASELVKHRSICGLEIVKCDGEDASAGEAREQCAYAGERRLAAAHRETCPFRDARCRHCDRVVRARRLSAHEIGCEARTTVCETCGATVLEHRVLDHGKRECLEYEKRGRSRCDFERFGCVFSGSTEALRVHSEEASAKHLRFVALAVEHATSSYEAWYGDVVTLRDEVAASIVRSERTVAEARGEAERVESASRLETDETKILLGELRAHYETELLKLRETSRRASAASEKRLQALVSENATLRASLATKMTKTEAEEMESKLVSGMDEMKTLLDALRAETENRASGWTKEVATIKQSVLETNELARACARDVSTRVSNLERSDLERFDRVQRELREFNAETIKDLDDLAERQRILERRLRDARDRLHVKDAMTTRGSPEDADPFVAEFSSLLRWAKTGEADAAVPHPESLARNHENATTESRSPASRVAPPLVAVSPEHQRGVHAAALLFGRGSRRAYPTVRSSESENTRAYE
jgi:hypothetical protein